MTDPNTIPPEILQQLMQAQAIKEQQKQDAQRMELGIADQLGPDGMREQIAMHTIPQRMELRGAEMAARDEMLGRQLAQARAIRGKGRQFNTVGGQIASGLGDAAGNFLGGMRERELIGQAQANNQGGFGDMRGMLDRMDAGGAAGVGAQHDYMRKMFGDGPQRPASPFANASSFGDGVELPAFALPRKQDVSSFGDGVQIPNFELPQKKPMTLSALTGMKLPFLGG